MEHQNYQRQKPEKVADEIFRVLRKEYVVVGKTHVRAWHAWLVLGAVVGMVGGVLLVANRSGKFDPSSAAGAPPLTLAAVPLPSNTLQSGAKLVLYRFSGTAYSDGDVTTTVLNFLISSRGAEVTSINLLQYADSSFSQFVEGIGPTSQVEEIGPPELGKPEVRDDGTNHLVVVFGGVSQPHMVIPAGTTRYFELRADVLKKPGLAEVGVGLNSVKLAVKISGLPVQTLSGGETMAITVLSPNGGEVWPSAGQITDTLSGFEAYRRDITWTGAPKDFKAVHDGIVKAYLEKYENGQYVTIGRILPFAFGSIAWVVGVVGMESCGPINGVDPNGCFNRNNIRLVPAGGQYFVRVVNTQTDAWDRSDRPFSISSKPIVMRTFRASPTTAASGQQVVLDMNVENAARLGVSMKCQDGLTPQYQKGDFDFTCDGKENTIAADTKQAAITFVNSGKTTLRAAIVLTAYDAAGTAQRRSVTVSVRPAPSITVLSPNGGEQWAKGTTQTIKWNANTSVANVQLQLWNSSRSQYWLVCSSCTGNQYAWTIPASFSSGNVVFQESGSYTLRAVAMGPNGTIGSDDSDAPFSITATLSAPTSQPPEPSSSSDGSGGDGGGNGGGE